MKAYVVFDPDCGHTLRLSRSRSDFAAWLVDLPPEFVEAWFRTEAELGDMRQQLVLMADDRKKLPDLPPLLPPSQEKNDVHE